VTEQPQSPERGEDPTRVSDAPVPNEATAGSPAVEPTSSEPAPLASEPAASSEQPTVVRPAPGLAPAPPPLPPLPPAPEPTPTPLDRASALATERPEIAVGAAFAGGFALAMILKRLGR
jgi:hypothetical protein